MDLSQNIFTLRKKNGWSQEELAEKLHVSRQSVSKWESAAATPDIHKLVELAGLFGVTVDELLRREEPRPAEPAGDRAGAAACGSEADTPADAAAAPRLQVTGQEALYFLDRSRAYGRQTGLAVFLCICSPIALIVLAGLAEERLLLSENAAAGIGVAVLLLLVAVAVALFISGGIRMQVFRYLKSAPLQLDEEAGAAVREGAAALADSYRHSLMAGVVLCILAVLPLVIAGACGASDLLCICLTGLLLLIIACAVYLFVSRGMEKGSYSLLLQEDSYSPPQREQRQKEDRFSGFYWPLVTAAYLAWSFLSGRWDRSWLIWPCAALLFAALSSLLKKEE